MPTLYRHGPRTVGESGNGAGAPDLAVHWDEGTGGDYDHRCCGIEANGAGEGYNITMEGYRLGELEYPNGNGEGVGHYETATMEIVE